MIATTHDDAALVVLLAGPPVLGALFGASLGRWADARNRRREQYADAVRVLVAWSEYPYRVLRRTSDDPDELRRLIDLGHDMQEQLQCHRTWIEAESRQVGSVYEGVVATVKKRAGAAIIDAWRADPITSGADVVLVGFGGRTDWRRTEGGESRDQCRFGLRRGVVWLPLFGGWRR